MEQIFNLTKSAEMVGISRMTLVRHIQKGKLSSTKDKFGKKGVEVSELIRCYGELKNVDVDITPSSDRTDVTDNTELIQQLKTTIEDLRRDKTFLEGRILSLEENLKSRLFGLIEDKSEGGKSKRKSKPKKGKKKKKK
jgi:predicted site-specific integrase-resolvase